MVGWGRSTFDPHHEDIEEEEARQSENEEVRILAPESESHESEDDTIVDRVLEKSVESSARPGVILSIEASPAHEFLSAKEQPVPGAQCETEEDQDHPEYTHAEG